MAIWQDTVSDQGVAASYAEQFEDSGSMGAAAGIFAALMAAQLSGFGVYLLASTALGALTGAVGIAFPFAAYAAVSSAIAVAIGPVGWIGAGLFAIWALTDRAARKLTLSPFGN
jgi:hypothetical protein